MGRSVPVLSLVLPFGVLSCTSSPRQGCRPGVLDRIADLLGDLSDKEAAQPHSFAVAAGRNFAVEAVVDIEVVADIAAGVAEVAAHIDLVVAETAAMKLLA